MGAAQIKKDHKPKGEEGHGNVYLSSRSWHTETWIVTNSHLRSACQFFNCRDQILTNPQPFFWLKCLAVCLDSCSIKELNDLHVNLYVVVIASLRSQDIECPGIGYWCMTVCKYFLAQSTWTAIWSPTLTSWTNSKGMFDHERATKPHIWNEQLDFASITCSSHAPSSADVHMVGIRSWGLRLVLKSSVVTLERNEGALMLISRPW